MTEKQLLFELDNVSGLLENRQHVSKLVLQDIKAIDSLFYIVFKTANKISVKAAWVLEFVVKQELKVIFPYLDYLSKNTQRIYFGGAARSIAKITLLIIEQNNKEQILSKKQEQAFVEIAFDWLISNHKVAIKAYTMQILFFLGKKHDWVHTELINILQENVYKYSPAYKTRARITLEQIRKFKNNKN